MSDRGLSESEPINGNRNSNRAMHFNPSYVGRRDDVLSLIPASCRRVLDVGCSVGAFGEQVKKKTGAYVAGVEIDAAMAREAAERLDHVLVLDLDVSKLTEFWGPGAFDCIVFADVLEHLKNPWRTLLEATTLLIPGGYVVASIPNIRHYTTIMRLALIGEWPYRDRGLHDRTHLRFFTLQSVRDLFRQANLEIKQIARNYRILERPHRINGVVQRFSKLLAVPPFRELLVFQYLIVSQKPVTKRSS